MSKVNHHRPTAVDLFCGSGAVTAALRRSGFRVRVAVDNDPVACATFKLNHRATRVVCDDICKVEPSRHRAFRDLSKIDLLVACAPCQPFSSQNRKRQGDVRAELLLQTVKFAEHLAPTVVLFENVSGLAAPESAEVLNTLCSRLRAVGYLLSSPRRIDAADLGVPQRRVRCVMIAAKSDEALETFARAELPRAAATVRSAIGHLPALTSGQRDENDRLHFARKHKDIVLERLKHIPPDGGSRCSLPEHLELRCHRGRKKSFSDVYGRMHWDDVAPTLTTGCTDVTRGRYVHPDQDRAITLREAALLQTFPQNYRFHGNIEQISRQIGNAVPVKMVEALMAILTEISGARIDG